MPAASRFFWSLRPVNLLAAKELLVEWEDLAAVLRGGCFPFSAQRAQDTLLDHTVARLRIVHVITTAATGL